MTKLEEISKKKKKETTIARLDQILSMSKILKLSRIWIALLVQQKARRMSTIVNIRELKAKKDEIKANISIILIIEKEICSSLISNSKKKIL